MTPIEALAARQLEAYNRADLDAFCACYHASVVVLEGDRLVCEGIDALRERYRPKFEGAASTPFGATVDTRLLAGDHCVDEERWWVEARDGRVEGRILVRYTLRDERIGVAQFFR